MIRCRNRSQMDEWTNQSMLLGTTEKKINTGAMENNM